MSSTTKIYEEKMNNCVAHLDRELTSIRAGRANPGILDKVMVDYYGSPTPVQQVASVAVSEARILTITPWDGTLIKAISKAIQTSDIGINPIDDGHTIRLVFPAPTEERRKQLTKDVQKQGEEAKVAVRNVRRDAMDKFKAQKKAGELTEEGAKLLDPSGALKPGIVLAPPEGDAGTGMVATNSVRVRTGNVSAGTSIFAMVVLEHKLKALHPEVDLVTTPAGDLAGMSHANNFTSDLNAWVGLFGQFAKAIGQPVDAGMLYGTLFRAAIADDVDANCGGLLNYPFRSGEFLAGLPEGRPLFARSPEANMTLGNFMRAQLFSAFSPVKIGMDVMTKQERVQVDSLVGHGGIFATPKVAQKILAAAFNTPIKVMSTAAEGGAWGMAVLANYLWNTNEDHSNLADFLDGCVFKDAQSTTEKPVASDVVGFEDFFARFTKGLPIEHAAIETINLEDK